MEFENGPQIVLPDGWSCQREDGSRDERANILDEQGRARGYCYQLPHLPDRAFLVFSPRFTFNHGIVASTPGIEKEAKVGNHTVVSCGGHYPYWMSSISSEGKDILPCFIYVHPGFWPIEKADCDFTRIEQELESIKKAEIFIAQQTRKIFPGAAIKAGTEEVTLRAGRESMAIGIDLEGDVFAHWDADADENFARLRSILEANVPDILGRDNSLIFAAFPAPEDIAAFKENAPFYTPPPPQKRQSALGWVEKNIGNLFNRKPG
jgi:hypothetical protein